MYICTCLITLNLARFWQACYCKVSSSKTIQVGDFTKQCAKNEQPRQWKNFLDWNCPGRAVNTGKVRFECLFWSEFEAEVLFCIKKKWSWVKALLTDVDLRLGRKVVIFLLICEETWWYKLRKFENKNRKGKKRKEKGRKNKDGEAEVLKKQQKYWWKEKKWLKNH